jgi:hypothetical protein
VILLDSVGLNLPDVPFFEVMKWPLVGEFATKFITPDLMRQQLQTCLFNQRKITTDMVQEWYLPATFRSNREAFYQLVRERIEDIITRSVPDPSNYRIYTLPLLSSSWRSGMMTQTRGGARERKGVTNAKRISSRVRILHRNLLHTGEKDPLCQVLKRPI